LLRREESRCPSGGELEVSAVFVSRYMPCTECGESVERTTADVHRCDPERALDYQMFGLREAIAAFETKFHAFLGENRGRFEVWLAARKVGRKD
jgi:hypothetical protein